GSRTTHPLTIDGLTRFRYAAYTPLQPAPLVVEANFMAKRIPACVLFVLFSFLVLGAQEPNHHQRQPTLTPQNSGTTNLIISVSPVDSRVVWAGAANGTFLVTTDGGNHWRSGVVPGAEALQFRDVQGVSSRVAYLMSIGDNPTDFRIYKTNDGGS